ncbi:unnamed protein product [Tenebrio molitor]|nr:unnamed protein product [Tenebrio molitor]
MTASVIEDISSTTTTTSSDVISAIPKGISLVMLIFILFPLESRHNIVCKAEEKKHDVIFQSRWG